MAKKRAYHIRSNQTTTINGVTLPKLPTINDINVGELAINYKDGFETLSIRNDNDEIVTFATLELLQAYIENEAKLSENYQTSALTGNALALAAGDNLDTFAGKLEKQIEENELVISSALNDLNSRVTNLSLPNDYEKSSLPDGQLDLNPGDSYNNAFSKLEAQIESDGLVTSAALNDLNSRVTNVENNPPELSSNYQTSTLTNSNLRLQPGENLDTVAGKLEKAILDDETITAAALNDLNRRKLEKITGGVSGNLVIIDSNGNVVDSGFSANEIEGTDTKNTAGSTNTSNKLYIIGAETLDTNPQTYSQSSVYIGNDGKLRSGFGINSATDSESIVATENYVETAIEPKADKVPEVNHGTSDTTFTLTPNIMHIWGEVETLNLSLSTDSNSLLDEYMFTFTCPSTAATNLTLPASIKWIQQPELLAGKTYQVSIVNGLAGYLTDDMPTVGDENIIEEIQVNGTALSVIDKVVNITIPTAVSDLTNDSGFTSNIGTVTSVTVNGSNYTPDANGLVNLGTISGGSSGGEANVIESVKVNGTALTVTNKAVDITAVPASIVTQDATHRFVSDTEKSTWNGKQAALVSGTNIKTVNSTSLLGSGNISIDANSIIYNSISANYHYTNEDDSINMAIDNLDDGLSTVASSASSKVSNIAYDSTNKKLTQTKSSNTTDIVTAALIVADGGGITFVPSLSKGTTTGSGNAVTDISVNGHTVTLTKGSTFLTSHLSIKTLNTNNTTAQTANASEAIAGSGTINLHKVAKTGSYNDLLNKPTIPTALADLTADATHRLVTDTEKSTWNSKSSTDTKNTAGATATTVTGSNKFYLVGAPEQTANPTTNTINYFYVDASGLNIPTDIYALQKTATLGKIILPGTGGGILADGTGDVQSTTKVWNTFGSYTDISGYITSSDIPTLSKGTTTGSGNAVTDISVSGHTITLTKGIEFLTTGASSDDILYDPSSSADTSTIGPGLLTTCLEDIDDALDTKQNTSDKVTSISSSSTNTQYPSALAVYNFGTNLVGQLTTIYSGSGAPSSSLGNNGDIYIKVS